MTLRRWASGLALGALLAVAGCSDGVPSPGVASETPATSAATTRGATPDEEAAQDATAAFTELLQVTDAARQDPGARDWEPEIRRYAADPAAFLAAKSVRDYAALGLRQTGESEVALEVTEVDLTAPEGPTVRFTGCNNSESTQVVNVDSGQPVAPGTLPRYVWDITVAQYTAEPGQPWLVTILEPRTDQPC